MAFTPVETESIKQDLEAFLERKRPPPEIRHKVDLTYRIENQSVTVVEVRAAWRGPPGATIELPIAKATYVRKHDHWRVYWQRADLKWHRYDSGREVKTVAAFLRLVDRDEHNVFFG